MPGLLVFLILFFILSAAFSYLKEKSFLSPAFLLSIMMSFCLIIMQLNYYNWNIQVNGNFVLLLIVGSISFFIGYYLFYAIFYKKNKNKEIKIRKPYRDNFPYIFFAIISILLFLVYIVSTLSYVGIASSISATLRRIYEGKREFTKHNPIYNQLGKIIIALAYICIYQFFRLIFVCKLKKRKKEKYFLLLIPIIFSLLYTLIATDRNVLIRFFIYAVVLWIYFFIGRKEHSIKYYNKKIIKYIVIVGILFALVFYISGKIKQYSSNFTRMISIYAGSGLQNTNVFMDRFKGDFVGGKNTFYSVISLFQGFGMLSDVEVIDPVTYPGYISYVSPNGYIYASNVYSSFQAFYNDFGYIGVCSLMFIQGAFFGILYALVKRRNGGFRLIVYASLINAVFYVPILEQFYSRIHLGLVYELFWLAIIYVYSYKIKRIRVFSKTNSISRTMTMTSS